ncbi:TonB-dependent receptor [Sphingomicrobium flavum]|uniref:TonB-dependent receptor n=1 Tax=Sphingomicrobium flavum TaxID=1229164 RepID=UPI0021ADEC57|nr:TonB-dependent receptor [Sphingomicrobium flavum]
MNMFGDVIVKKAFLLGAALPAMAIALTPATATAQERERLTVDIFALLNDANGETSDGFEDQDASGFVAGGDAELDIRRGDHRFAVGAGSTYFAFSEDDRDDRFNNAFWGTYSYDFADDWTFWVQGRHDTELATLESSEARQDRLRSQVIWSKGDQRVRFRAGYRWREYISDDTDGEGLEIGTDYRRRFDNGVQTYTYLRWDEIEADRDRRSYTRWTLGTDINVPVSDRIELIPSLRFRTWTYPNREVNGHERHDGSFNPRLTVTYDLGDGWEALARGGVIWRRSNDDRFDETITRLSVGVSKRFRWDL